MEEPEKGGINCGGIDPRRLIDSYRKYRVTVPFMNITLQV
jgi:hypothetical protein